MVKLGSFSVLTAPQEWTGFEWAGLLTVFGIMTLLVYLLGLVGLVILRSTKATPPQQTPSAHTSSLKPEETEASASPVSTSV